MDSSRDTTSHADPLCERDKQILQTYGKLPRRASLGQQKRVYFDSGDFALSAAHRGGDNGAIQTGTAHPVRESISHPYVPIPNDKNNVPAPEVAKSPLSQDWNEYIFDPDGLEE
ncbi:hypothetical protein BJX76DRAFT_339367 [Aspergillus varians]